jgi:hypothetical protein
MDGGGEFDGVVVGVRNAYPAPGVHAEQSQAAAMPHLHRDGGRRAVVVSILFASHSLRVGWRNMCELT